MIPDSVLLIVIALCTFIAVLNATAPHNKENK